MAVIKQVPEDGGSVPKISKLKLFVLTMVIVGAIALGVTIQMRGNKTNVLGTETVDLQDLAADEFGKALGENKDILVKGKSPEMLMEESQMIIASKTAELGNMANMSIEKVASEAAQNATDFIYRNTIERVIDTLILSLPENRQKQYIQ